MAHGRIVAAAAIALVVTAAVAQTDPAAAAAAAHERAITDRYLRTIHAEVNGKIDTHTAKPGQQVALRVTADAELADGTRLPKNSRLLGMVMLAQTRTDHQPAALILNFDRAALSSGETVPVRAVIEMLAPVGGVGKAEPMDRNPGGGGMYSAPAIGIADSTRVGMGSGGGVIGNVGRGVGDRGSMQPPIGGTGGIDPGTGMPTSGMPGSTTGSMPGQVGINGTGSGQMGQIGMDGRDTIGAAGPIGSRPIDDIAAIPAGGLGTAGVRPVVSAGETTSAGARITALPGVVLSQPSGTAASGMLMSTMHDIRLDSGTEVTLGVIRR